MEASRNHPSPGPDRKGPGHHGAIMPAVNALLELGAKSRALRTRSDKGHPFCQDEKTRLRRHFMREAALDADFEGTF